MMSKEKRRVPKLRFPGFTEDWEQRKLGDIATFSKGNGYSKSDLAPSGNPIILYGRLYTNYETTISNVDTFVELKDKSVLSQGGEVIVPASGETAEDISRASVVKNQGIIIGGDLNVIKANHLLNPTFLALTISNGGQQKELSKRAQGKSVVHLHNSDLQEVNLIFPLLNEQKEISTLFEKMDNIITLHQRKLDNFKLKKKALLQKLFPKNGERYPELRFPGFTDAWEQRKLSDISTKVTTKNADVHYTETLTNSAEQGIISQVDFFDKEISNKDNINGYYIVENNDFIYNPRISTLAPVGPINRNKLNRTGIMSPLYTVFRASNVDLGFLEWYFQSNHWHRYMKLNGDSGARADRIAIKDSTFFEMPIKTPVNIKEQVLIGETLEKFNQYITLHQ